MLPVCKTWYVDASSFFSFYTFLRSKKQRNLKKKRKKESKEINALFKTILGQTTKNQNYALISLWHFGNNCYGPINIAYLSLLM